MTVYPSVNETRLPLVPPLTPAPSPVFGSSRRGSIPVSSRLTRFTNRRLFVAAVLAIVGLGFLGRLALTDQVSVSLHIGVSLVFLCGSLISLVVPSLLSFKKSSQESLVAVVDVEIDAETTVTVRSWWPSHLSVDSVRSNGTRVALQNAQQWVTNNRPAMQPQFKLTEPIATNIISKFLVSAARPTKRGSLVQCAVCLEEISRCGHTEFSPLPCGHVFHPACLSDWFVRSCRLQCPLCRADHSALVPESEIPNEKPTIRVQVTAVRIESAALVTSS